MTGVTNGITSEARNPEVSWKGMTVGLDLSDNYSSFCLLDAFGEVIEEGRVRTTASSFSQPFGGMAPCPSGARGG